jgi:predicted O-methyltransferase YrrM
VSELLKSKLHEEITSGQKSIGVYEIDGQRLAYLAAQVPENGVIVEIGSHRGRSAAYMAAAAKDSVAIYCIDLWDNPGQERFVSTDEDYDAFEKFLTKLGLRKNIIALRGESEMFSRAWQYGIDLLFIDGDHSYKGVKADFEAWYPHVRDGGVIAFHDYHKNWPGVIKFIEETASKKLKYLGLDERVWSGQK